MTIENKDNAQPGVLSVANHPVFTRDEELAAFNDLWASAYALQGHLATVPFVLRDLSRVITGFEYDSKHDRFMIPSSFFSGFYDESGNDMEVEAEGDQSISQTSIAGIKATEMSLLGRSGFKFGQGSIESARAEEIFMSIRFSKEALNMMANTSLDAFKTLHLDHVALKDLAVSQGADAKSYIAAYQRIGSNEVPSMSVAINSGLVSGLAEANEAFLNSESVIDAKAVALGYANSTAALLARKTLSTLLTDYNKLHDHIVSHNLRLVIPQAKKKLGGRHDLGFEDLIQEGNIGLLRAVDKFIPSKGYKFSTYAVWWIRQQVEAAVISLGRAVPVPQHLTRKIKNMQRMYVEHEIANGKAPTKNELATICNLPVDVVNEYMALSSEVSSLNVTVGNSDDMKNEVQDLLPSELFSGLEDSVDSDIYEKALVEAIDRLDNDNQRHVMRMRFGLNGLKPSTLETVSNSLSLTRERVRQIQMSAFNLLQNDPQLIALSTGARQDA